MLRPLRLELYEGNEPRQLGHVLPEEREDLPEHFRGRLLHLLMKSEEVGACVPDAVGCRSDNPIGVEMGSTPKMVWTGRPAHAVTLVPVTAVTPSAVTAGARAASSTARATSSSAGIRWA